MNREIYTYTNLEQIANSQSFQKIKKYPQLVVSSNLRKSMVGDIDHDHVRGVFAGDSVIKVEELRSILTAIDPFWATDPAKFEQTVTLSEFFRKEIHTKGDDVEVRKWLVGCRRNSAQLLSAINLLEEADVKPDDLSFSSDRNIHLLIDAWNYLIENNGTINRFRDNMAKLDSRAKWNEIFLEKFQTKDVDTVVMHGFYYITPIQQRIMNSLERLGIKLIFLFQYDERYPYVHEIWRKTYSEENGYPEFQDWIKDNSRVVDVYGSLFEGEVINKRTNKLTIREYSSVMEFVNDIKSEKNNKVSIYSSNHLTANRILQHFYPQDYGERKLLSYPIGQFVATLNSLWDEEAEDVILNEDRIIECFSSGWLAKNGVSGKELMQDLINILPFFKGTERLEDWEKKINYLKQIKTEVVNSFDVELDADERVSRWQHIAGNPFTNFGVFNVEEDKLDTILDLIKQLIEMARDLFTKSTEINIGVHIKKLESILYEHEMSSKLFDEELEVVKELFTKLDEPEGYSSKCFPGDIATALNVYLSGRFDDNELQPNKVGLVYPMFQIDSSVFDNNKVHICLCDVDSMPGGNKRYIWPLTGRVINECLLNGQKEGRENKLIRNLIEIMESNAESNRYFMYCALKNKDVTLSWISEMRDKLLVPSPYIGLLKEAFNLEVKNYNRFYIPYERVEKSETGQLRMAPYDNDRMPDNILKEARMDYALCSLRYIFGYVMEKNPSFEGEFQQNYAITSLIRTIHKLLKEDNVPVTVVYDNVVNLFPGLRKVERRQIKDYITAEDNTNDIDFAGTSECGNRKYTEERIRIHFPNVKVRKAALNEYKKLNTPDGKVGMLIDEEIDMVDICTFCPHQSFCRKAKYVIDVNDDEEERYYD
ncbi:hypothetical protein SAMN06297422_101161 [Lachnospiraceae bacterium]|nr:hypothetical protein SAMN06297422_101161 [Lachnospiraceae bacterium]